MGAKRLLKIGEAAERVDLSIRTMRYWEEVGLVTPSARSAGGFRLYDESDIERLLVVKHMKPLGLTLDEMRELLVLVEQSLATEATAAERSQLLAGLERYEARAHERIERTTRDLEQARALLATIQVRVATVRGAAKAAPEPSARAQARATLPGPAAG